MEENKNTQQLDENVCIHCGIQIKEGAKFCPYCGRSQEVKDQPEDTKEEAKEETAPAEDTTEQADNETASADTEDNVANTAEKAEENAHAEKSDQEDVAQITESCISINIKNAGKLDDEKIQKVTQLISNACLNKEFDEHELVFNIDFEGTAKEEKKSFKQKAKEEISKEVKSEIKSGIKNKIKAFLSDLFSPNTEGIIARSVKAVATAAAVAVVGAIGGAAYGKASQPKATPVDQPAAVESSVGTVTKAQSNVNKPDEPVVTTKGEPAVEDDTIDPVMLNIINWDDMGTEQNASAYDRAYSIYSDQFGDNFLGNVNSGEDGMIVSFDTQTALSESPAYCATEYKIPQALKDKGYTNVNIRIGSTYPYPDRHLTAEDVESGFTSMEEYEEYTKNINDWYVTVEIYGDSDTLLGTSTIKTNGEGLSDIDDINIDIKDYSTLTIRVETVAQSGTRVGLIPEISKA